MKKQGFGKRLLAVLLVSVMFALTGTQSVSAVTGVTIIDRVDNYDFKGLAGPTKIQWVYTMKCDGRFLTLRYSYGNGGVSEGDTLYIRDYTYTCNGLTYYGVIHDGRVFYINKKYIDQSQIVPVKQGAYAGNKKITAKAIAGDVTSDQGCYYYIYSKPKDSDPTYCIGVVPVGTTLSVIKKNYNSKWAQISYYNTVGYIRKADITTRDSYLADTSIEYTESVKLAKKARLTYAGILKHPQYELTRQEFCRLAVNWYKATGHKLPKQRRTSPYTDTKNRYVILASQLGIIPKTSKKFYPDKKISSKEYNAWLKKLVNRAHEEKSAYYAAVTEDSVFAETISREKAVSLFYSAYKAAKGKLTTGVNYIISPASNKKLCLDLWEWSKDRGATIGLYEKNGGENQQFYLMYQNGFTTLRNRYSRYTLNGNRDSVYQDEEGYDSEKLNFKYNSDGTVCIRNEEGLYLDIKGGKAVSEAELMFAPKSNSKTQRWVITF